MKKEILNKIKESLSTPIKCQNSMGCSEAYYDGYYMLGKCFAEEELNSMSEKHLVELLKLADFAGEVFY